MEKQLNEKKESKIKTIAYSYSFNYFGEEKYQNNNVSGVFLDIAIRLYKNGKEIKLTEYPKEPKSGKFYLFDVFKVSFDKKKIAKIKRNPQIFDLFRLIYDADDIKAEIIGYGIDIEEDMPQDLLDKLPNNLKDLSYSRSISVSKEEFEIFVKSDLNGFDIKDNMVAQVPAYKYID